MSYYRINLKAGNPLRHNAAGKLILLDSTGAAPSVDVRPLSDGSDGVLIPDRKAGFRIVQPFMGVEFTAPVDCTIGVFLTSTDVSNGLTEGSQISVTGQVEVSADTGSPLPVAIEGGVTLTASNVGINNNDAAAVPTRTQALGNIVDYAEVTIPGIAAISLINDPTLRKLRFRNNSVSGVVALGGSAVTVANTPIILQPGDVYMEDDAAGAHWYAITDTPGAKVQLQGLK